LSFVKFSLTFANNCYLYICHSLVSRLFVCLSGPILLPRYLANDLNNFDETDTDYSLVTTDDLIRLWRSKVRVTSGLSMWWLRLPRRR